VGRNSTYITQIQVAHTTPTLGSVLCTPLSDASGREEGSCCRHHCRSRRCRSCRCCRCWCSVAKIVPVVVIALPCRHTSLRDYLCVRALVLKVNINKIGRTRYIGPTTGAKWTAFRRMGARVIAGCERALGRVVGSNLEIITENNQ
jgi:hypothetical protein